MEIKFTSDGKKVVIVGKLNSTDTIVQEVFMINDCEIPSGEHFVVKSLHDAPAISWKELKLKELEARFNQEEKAWRNEIDRLTRIMRTKTDEIKARISYAGEILKNVSPESFDLLIMFLNNEIEYVVVDTYEPKLVKWADYSKMYEKKLRLISIFGQDDGTLNSYIHQYYDGSGNGGEKIQPFSNYNDALDSFKKLILSKKINEYIIKVSKEYGIDLDKEKLSAYKTMRITEFQKDIENMERNISSRKELIDQVNSI